MAKQESRRKMVCPNGCDAGFTTTAHIAQEWEVDGFGNFQKVSVDCLEVTHDPSFDNIWTCTKCGAEGEAKMVSS